MNTNECLFMQRLQTRGGEIWWGTALSQRMITALCGCPTPRRTEDTIPGSSSLSLGPLFTHLTLCRSLSLASLILQELWKKLTHEQLVKESAAKIKTERETPGVKRNRVRKLTKQEQELGWLQREHKENIGICVASLNLYPTPVNYEQERGLS